MDHTIDEKLGKGETTLLILNDYCLMNIFEFLELDDFVNLHKTCHRLRDVSAIVCALKYKKN